MGWVQCYKGLNEKVQKPWLSVNSSVRKAGVTLGGCPTRPNQVAHSSVNSSMAVRMRLWAYLQKTTLAMARVDTFLVCAFLQPWSMHTCRKGLLLWQPALPRHGLASLYLLLLCSWGVCASSLGQWTQLG